MRRATTLGGLILAAWTMTGCGFVGNYNPNLREPVYKEKTEEKISQKPSFEDDIPSENKAEGAFDTALSQFLITWGALKKECSYEHLKLALDFSQDIKKNYDKLQESKQSFEESQIQDVEKKAADMQKRINIHNDYLKVKKNILSWANENSDLLKKMTSGKKERGGYMNLTGDGDISLEEITDNTDIEFTQAITEVLQLGEQLRNQRDSQKAREIYGEYDVKLSKLLYETKLVRKSAGDKRLLDNCYEIIYWGYRNIHRDLPNDQDLIMYVENPKDKVKKVEDVLKVVFEMTLIDDLFVRSPEQYEFKIGWHTHPRKRFIEEQRDGYGPSAPDVSHSAPLYDSNKKVTAPGIIFERFEDRVIIYGTDFGVSEKIGEVSFSE